MAKPEFRAAIDGEGRVRFFVDGASHTMDEYVAKYVRYFGVLPEVPVGLGGAPAPEPAAEEPVEDPAVSELRARIVELEARLSDQGADREQGDVAEEKPLIDLTSVERDPETEPSNGQDPANAE